MASDRTVFDAQKANLWKKEVDAEFEAVKVLLRQVADECARDPVGDDTILSAMESVGQALNEKWSNLGRAYDNIQDKLDKSFNDYKKAINTGVQYIEDMKRKIKP